MTIATAPTWKPGMDLPYVVPLGEHGMLAIRLRAAWIRADRSGRPLLLPPAVRVLDRLRATFTTPATLTPGFIISLREAMGLTQAQFAGRLGVTKMTVSRWECGKMRPGAVATAAIRKLQLQSQRKGVKIVGHARTNQVSLTSHPRLGRM
jgi:DNA-binding transcriptional regulator YiaG